VRPNEPPPKFEEVYTQLLAIARQRLAGERPDHTLQATALVHEAWLKIHGDRPVDWGGRAQFFAAAAEAMRRILIDHARARRADKRGGGRRALSITGVADLAADYDPDGFLALDDAILRLEDVDRQAAAVVRLRFYAGLSEGEVAQALGLSERTARREWAFARGWLRDALERAGL
jgi:RNA polymerase sigma factor (TIGR02999 family)